MTKEEVSYNKLKSLLESSSKVLCIHCSRQNLLDNDNGRATPRVTAISVKSLDERMVKTFAIHLEAEKFKVEWEEVENYYDLLEENMIKEFNRFVGDCRQFQWLYWDTDGIHFGLEAIKHRYCVLVNTEGKGFTEIPIENRVNLNFHLKSIYGDDYESDPKLDNLMKSNNGGFTRNGFLTLEEEAHHFNRLDFPSILDSVNCKVDFIITTLKKVVGKHLIVSNSNFLYKVGKFFTSPLMIAIAWLATVLSLLWGVFH